MRHLEFQRNRMYPLSLNLLRRNEVLLRVYSERSSENARRANEELFMTENSRKALLGVLAGLQDPAVMSKKRSQEETLRAAVIKSADLARAYGDAWNQVDAAIRTSDEILTDRFLFVFGYGFAGKLFDTALTLVRLADETAKPNSERLREYSDSNLESMKLD